MADKKRYYITQYEAWWSLNKDEFLSLLKEMKDNGCYDLSRFKQLRNRPSCTHMFDGQPYTRKRDVEIVECLDWSWGQFKSYYTEECESIS